MLERFGFFNLVPIAAPVLGDVNVADTRFDLEGDVDLTSHGISIVPTEFAIDLGLGNPKEAEEVSRLQLV